MQKPVYHWKHEGDVLHIPNVWSPIGRLFLAPFLAAGIGLIWIAGTGVVMEVVRGRWGDLMREVPVFLGMLALGVLLAVPCYLGVFSWYAAVLDGKKRTVKVEEGAWPWIKRWKAPASAFKAVSIVEQDLMSDTDGGSSVTKQAVQLYWTEPKMKPHALERCDSYAEAEALAKVVSSLLRIPVVTRKK